MDDNELLIESVRKTLNTPFGKIVVWEILKFCSLYEFSNLPNPNDVYHRLGRQSVGVELLDLLEQVDKDAYAHLMLEQGDLDNDE